MRVQFGILSLLVVGLVSVPAHVWAQEPEVESIEELEVESIEELDLEALLATPVVESASKREQTVDEAPVTVTLMGPEEIATQHASNVAELLRQVPGVQVMQLHANQYFVGMRGINPPNSNRALTLFDGRDVSDIAFGRVQWHLLPAHPSDVEKIEVIRGPGSTLYGANAFVGVINIQSKRPLDHPGLETEVKTGLYSTPAKEGAEMLLHNGGDGYAAYGWANDNGTVGIRNSVGFTSVPEYEPFAAPEGVRHGQFSYHDRLALEVHPSAKTDIHLNVSHAMRENKSFTTTETTEFASREAEEAFTASIERRDLGVEGLDLKANADGRQVAVTILDEAPTNTTFHGVLQLDLSTFDGRNQTSVNADTTRRATSDFFGISADSLSTGVGAQNETRLLADRSLILSLGARAEVITSRGPDSEATYRNLSPRAAMTYQLSPDHSLRLGVSTAVRTPSLFESFIGVSAQIYPKPIPPNTLVQANPALRTERIRAAELGYRGRVGKLRLDAVVYGQQIFDMVAESPKEDVPSMFENVSDLNQIGFEAGVVAGLTSTTSATFNYALSMTTDAASGAKVDEYPQHLGSIGLEQRLPRRTRLVVDATLASSWAPEVREANAAGYLPVDEPEAFQANVDLRLSHRLREGGEIFVLGKNLAALARDRADVRQYPSNTVSPIGAALLIGAKLEGM